MTKDHALDALIALFHSETEFEDDLEDLENLEEELSEEDIAAIEAIDIEEIIRRGLNEEE